MHLINGPHDLTMFLTAAKRNRLEGRVICVRTHDGAKTWDFESYVCPEPKWKRDYAIMPSSVRLADGTEQSLTQAVFKVVRKHHAATHGKAVRHPNQTNRPPWP